jgi:hypothetical protein
MVDMCIPLKTRRNTGHVGSYHEDSPTRHIPTRDLVCLYCLCAAIGENAPQTHLHSSSFAYLENNRGQKQRIAQTITLRRIACAYLTQCIHSDKLVVYRCLCCMQAQSLTLHVQSFLTRTSNLVSD